MYIYICIYIYAFLIPGRGSRPGAPGRGLKSPAWGRPQAEDFDSKVARHETVQIKSQPAWDGTFLAPQTGLLRGLGGSS